MDFEEPVFISSFDLCYRGMNLWPNRTAGFYEIPVTSFKFSFQEEKNAKFSIASEKRVLGKIVSDYNRSGNPGKFALRNEGKGRFAVVGEYVEDDQGDPKK